MNGGFCNCGCRIKNQIDIAEVSAPSKVHCAPESICRIARILASAVGSWRRWFFEVIVTQYMPEQKGEAGIQRQ